MFLSEWREFHSTPCLARKNLDESTRLDVVEIEGVPTYFRACLFPVRGNDLLIPQ